MFLVIKFLVYMEVLTIGGLLGFRYCLAPDARKLISPKVIALGMLLPVMGCLLRWPILLYSALIVLAAFSGRKQSEVAANWVFLLPLLPALESPVMLGSTYLLRISTIVALNIGGVLGVLIARRERSIRNYGAVVPSILLTLLFIYIDGRQLNATTFLRVALNAAFLYLLPGPIITAGLGSRAAIDRFSIRFLAGAFICSSVALFEAVRSWPLYQGLYSFLNVPLPAGSATLNIRAGFLRAPGPIGDPSSLGLLLAAALCILLAKRPAFRPRYHAYAVAWLIAGLLATQSRGAMLAAIVGVAVMQVYRRRAALLAPLLIGIAVVKIAADLVLPRSGRLAEVLGRSGQGATTADYRVDLFHRGLAEVWRHPLGGEPPDVAVQHLSDLMQGQHIVDFVNGHLYIALVSGLIGLALWLSIWLTPLVSSFMDRPRRSPREASLSAAVPGIIVAMFVGLIFTSLIDRNLIWPIIAFGLLKPAAVLRRQMLGEARHEEEPADPQADRSRLGEPQTA